MIYKIKVRKKVIKKLQKLDTDIRKKIVKAIDDLSHNPRPHGCKKLTKREDWRIRVGDYRIIYNIQDMELLIILISIGHRKDIYKTK